MGCTVKGIRIDGVTIENESSWKGSRHLFLQVKLGDLSFSLFRLSFSFPYISLRKYVMFTYLAFGGGEEHLS